MNNFNRKNTTDILFSIDRFDMSGIHGWAHTNNNEPLQLIVQSGNQPNKYVEANQFREDLQKNNKVDGYCAFFIPLEYLSLDNGVANVKITAKHQDFKQVILDKSLSFSDEDKSKLKLAKEAKVSKKRNYHGHIDYISRGFVKGWIADIGVKDTFLDLNVYINDELVTTIVANKYRRDLLDAGINLGNHGFELKLSTISEKIYSKDSFNLYIAPADIDYVLMDTPKTFNATDLPIENQESEVKVYKKLNLNNKMKEDINLIKESGLFDEEFYTKRHPDVVKANLKPIEHYVRTESREARNPNSLFDTKFYKKNYLTNSKENALVHYIKVGANLGVKTSKIFDSNAYLQANEDVKESKKNPLLHYLKFGIKEGRALNKVAIQANISHSEIESKIIPMDAFFSESPTCSIIIPVYNAVQETKECIESVLRNTDLTKHHVIVMNDCSPDAAVKPMLDTFGKIPGITIVHNKNNLGYTVNINEGIKIAKGTDILLLNSDTIVTPNWMKKLQVAAYSNINIGTVTAVSNNAGAFSVPFAGTNVIPEKLPLDRLAAVVSRVHNLEYMDVPTGNGFCFYIKNKLMESIGLFDEKSFPRGYGEENDFCMRAVNRGWRNIVDFKTYIYHVRTASFKEEKSTLIEKSLDIVRSRYPNYSALTKSIAVSPIMKKVRNKIKDALSAPDASLTKFSKPVVMYVLSTMTGGTPQTNRDLMKGVSEEFETLVLACDRNKIDVLELKENEYIVLETYKLKEPILFAAHGSSEYREIAASILFKYDVDILHIRHLAWHDLSLPKIAKKLDIKVMYSLHDFYTACPSVNLIDKNAIFYPLGAIENAANPLWNDVTCLPMTEEFHNLWKAKMNESLSFSDAFVTTNQSGKEILQNNLEVLKNRDSDFMVIPHGRDFDQFYQVQTSQSIKRDKKINILLPGNIGHSKGARLIKEIKENDVDGRYVFHVLGKCTRELNDFVINHGEYKREEFASKVQHINPDITAILSIWPETYCHTLTESWAMGLPVLAVDLGAVGDRIKRRGGGWLVGPYAEDIIKSLDSIIKQPSEIDNQKIKIEEWQNGYGRENNIVAMARRYKSYYQKLLS